MTKTRTRPRRPPHAGGRPLAFIPTAVVERGAQLYAQLRRWADVIVHLKREGNGTYARSTLIRRIRRTSTGSNGQNSDLVRTSTSASSRPRAVVKTRAIWDIE
jgi:hypothetical protein